MAGKKKVTDAETTPEAEKPAKNPHAQALGRLGGLKGGAARAKKLTAEERAAIAKRADQARWEKKS